MARDIILVHGSAHTGECWDLLRPELTRRGFVVHTPTLGGHRGNPRVPLATTMRTYGDDVLAVAQEIGEPSILLGHSMGGFVISEAAERAPRLVSNMVYLTAFVPAFGRSSMTRVAPASPMLAKSSKFHWNGAITFPGDAAKTLFYNRCAPEIQDYAVRLLSPQPIRAAVSSITVTEAALGSIRKQYIECTDDNALPLSSQRTMQSYLPFERVESIDSDHSPFYSMPETLAQVIDRITTG
jgi:pimeloyl-ACP methyl ester carboxylesterase